MKGEDNAACETWRWAAETQRHAGMKSISEKKMRLSLSISAKIVRKYSYKCMAIREANGYMAV